MSDYAAFFAFLAGFGILAFILIVAMYIFSALGLYKLAKNNNYEDKAFFAFIPVLNTYLYATMAGDVNIFGVLYIAVNVSAILYTVLPMITFIPFLGFVIFIAWSILRIYVVNGLYKRIDSQNATLMTVLTIFFPIVDPIYLFIKRNTIFNDLEYDNQGGYDSYTDISGNQNNNYNNPNNNFNNNNYSNNYNNENNYNNPNNNYNNPNNNYNNPNNNYNNNDPYNNNMN